jgi:hypothetical protein
LRYERFAPPPKFQLFRPASALENLS